MQQQQFQASSTTLSRELVWQRVPLPVICVILTEMAIVGCDNAFLLYMQQQTCYDIIDDVIGHPSLSEKNRPLTVLLPLLSKLKMQLHRNWRGMGLQTWLLQQVRIIGKISSHHGCLTFDGTGVSVTTVYIDDLELALSQQIQISAVGCSPYILVTIQKEYYLLMLSLPLDLVVMLSWLASLRRKSSPPLVQQWLCNF